MPTYHYSVEVRHNGRYVAPKSYRRFTSTSFKSDEQLTALFLASLFSSRPHLRAKAGELKVKVKLLSVTS